MKEVRINSCGLSTNRKGLAQAEAFLSLQIKKTKGIGRNIL